MESCFPQSRRAALERLVEFAPQAGRHYAANRNDASQFALSGLSPAIRHRLIAEPEVLRAVLARHSLEAADKFVQEVCWRSYWKGWLEQRPIVWADYCRRRDNQYAELSGDKAYQDAISGQTGLTCFDDWSKILDSTGYLHNHIRMWVASIWIFTLQLPWELGADWFMSRLLDGDAASNTLSWRWVAGLQTQGKHYLARAENIRKFTGGQYNPVGQLNETATPVAWRSKHPGPMPFCEEPITQIREGDAILLTDSDLSADCDGLELSISAPVAILQGSGASHRARGSQVVADFRQGVVTHVLDRLASAGLEPTVLDINQLGGWLQASDARRLVLPWVPVGGDRDALFESLSELNRPWAFWQRRWDTSVWPMANKGFFQFKKRLFPQLQDLLV